jgi:hypothetical protein
VKVRIKLVGSPKGSDVRVSSTPLAIRTYLCPAQCPLSGRVQDHVATLGEVFLRPFFGGLIVEIPEVLEVPAIPVDAFLIDYGISVVRIRRLFAPCEKLF